MTPAESAPWLAPDLNAMLTRSLRRYGNREAMYDGDETVTYLTLFRRAVALSCFVDEAALGPGGSVVLYLPSGLIALRSLLAVSLSGRASVPLDALARARRTPGADPATRFEERELADLRSLSSPVRLILTTTPLARYVERMKRECGLAAGCPVLFADEAARRMDDSHQDKIHERLAKATAGKLGHTRPGDVAIEFGRRRSGVPSGQSETADGLKLSQAQLMNAVASAVKAAVEASGPTAKDAVGIATDDATEDATENATEDGALVMTSTEEPITWTHGYLPALASGRRLNFIRFFYPAHVAQAIRSDNARRLLLTSAQYESLADELRRNQARPELQCLTNEIPSSELIARWAGASASAITPVAVAVAGSNSVIRQSHPNPQG